jgi:hypothetical protein
MPAFRLPNKGGKMNKAEASIITGGITHTSKMPCPSYSLPTVACNTGFRMAQIAGSICNSCYANKGNYHRYANNIEPAQHARLESINLAIESAEYRAEWLSAMQVLIGNNKYFRFHDSGDLQSVEHLELYAELARAMPDCRFWLPTREYGIVSAFHALHDIPENLTIRLSAMFTDKPVKIPASLSGVKGITASNVHSKAGAVSGAECPAYKQGGQCRDCRTCWTDTAVSYPLH